MITDEAPAGEALLDLLRGRGIPRPPADPQLAHEVRRRLEEAAAEAMDLEVTGAEPLRVTKQAVRRVLLCEGHYAAGDGGVARAAGPEVIRGALLDRLFAHVVAGHGTGPDPTRDALAAAEADGDRRLLDDWEALEEEDREEVRGHVARAVSDLRDRWPRLPANALPRLQETVRFPLAAGRVLLSARPDLMVGQPSAGRDGTVRPGTVILDVKAGRRRPDDAADAAWYAVIETLRHRVPPFQTGSYYLDGGRVELEPVDAGRLLHATDRAAEAVERIVRLAGGTPPQLQSNPLCPWCPAVHDCPEGGADG